MNKFYILVAVLFYTLHTSAQKQDITLDGLIACSAMKPEPLSDFLKHKGFKAYTDTLNTGLSFQRCNKDKTTTQVIGRSENTSCITISLQTTSQEEYASWLQELEKNGFLTYKDREANNQVVASFQKRNMKARISKVQNKKMSYYSLALESKKLPTPNEFQYAEDLLQLTTQEYIAAVFGPANVKEDLFHFSEKETSKCSILFPNTSNQVIFIWNDEENREDVSFLILGAPAGVNNNSNIFNNNQFHRWRSKQGIYLGMSLKELQTLNGKPLEFYGWDSDQPGFIVKKNSGHINFQSLGIQLQCLECYTANQSEINPIISSSSVINANDRVFVNTLIILPETESTAKLK